ncbi:hypothetical protein H4219_004570, partial [Mycoemilia scoparia]
MSEQDLISSKETFRLEAKLHTSNSDQANQKDKEDGDIQLPLTHQPQLCFVTCHESDDHHPPGETANQAALTYKEMYYILSEFLTILEMLYINLKKNNAYLAGLEEHILNFTKNVYKLSVAYNDENSSVDRSIEDVDNNHPYLLAINNLAQSGKDLLAKAFKFANQQHQLIPCSTIQLSQFGYPKKDYDAALNKELVLNIKCYYLGFIHLSAGILFMFEVFPTEANFDDEIQDILTNFRRFAVFFLNLIDMTNKYASANEVGNEQQPHHLGVKTTAVTTLVMTSSTSSNNDGWPNIFVDDLFTKAKGVESAIVDATEKKGN